MRNKSRRIEGKGLEVGGVVRKRVVEEKGRRV